MWKTFNENWRSFAPALGAILLGIVFISVPELAAFLVSGLLFGFAIFYTQVVYRIHEARRGDVSHGPGFGQAPPNFKNVTFRMYQSTPFHRDIN